MRLAPIGRRHGRRPMAAALGRWPARMLAALAVLSAGAAPSASSQERVLADGESLDGWSAVTPEGVTLRLSRDAGRTGSAVRLDYDFHGHGGYAIARLETGLTLPENYRFRWWIRAEGPEGAAPPVQDHEFKLVDPSGTNVWWHNRRRFEYPARWTRLTSRARHVTFAWGPTGGPPERIGSVEFVVTAVTGGRGTVWIDDVTFEPLPPSASYAGTPVASSTTGAGSLALDGDSRTEWVIPPVGGELTVDFGQDREFGGLTLDWGSRGRIDYDVDLSDDGRAWTTLRRIRDSNGGRDRLYLPESEARAVRVRVHAGGGPDHTLSELIVEPVASSTTPNDWLQHVAETSPPGLYPRSLRRQGTFWTVVGVDRDEAEAIVGEDGEVEVGKRRFTLEPFLWTGERLLTWYDADSTTQSLAEAVLPIPTITRHHGTTSLETTAFAAGDSGRAVLYLRYRLRGTASGVRLLVAARPWGVNPPYQFLNVTGGFAPVRDLRVVDGALVVDGSAVVPLNAASDVGVASSAMGDASDWIAQGEVPPASVAYDSTGFGSAALAFDVHPGREVWLAVPMDGSSVLPVPALTEAAARSHGEGMLAATRGWWRERLAVPDDNQPAVELVGPPSLDRIRRTLRTQPAYILINRDGRAIQPGSRSYDRSWIRDGSLTSSAMLRLGYVDVARDFARWFAPRQYPSGKVPCCVDERGGDPVDEHDSHGQLLFLLAEVYRYTGDRAFLRSLWPHVGRTVAYADSMRHTRMTSAYTAGDSVRAYYGLMPESISHEGYSDRPVHSYWDQLFVLRGLRDAVTIAEVLGETTEAERFRTVRDAFATDLAASYARTMAMHDITYVPGSVEKGDFDATSVTIALDPVEAEELLPEGALGATFERYWQFLESRAAGATEWDGYTPYELRTVGTFARLGQPDRALAALGFFFSHQYPSAWYQWAEVVWSDPRKPGYVGDMPHTWVGSDFVRSALDLFAYHEADRLVVGAGLVPEWFDAEGGVGIRHLRTPYGLLSYIARRDGEEIVFDIEAGPRLPSGGVVVRNPNPAILRAARIDGAPAQIDGAGNVVVRALPARVAFEIGGGRRP